MRPVVAVVLLALPLAGCVADDGADGPDPEAGVSDARVLTGPGCPLSFPDGAQAPCEAPALSQPEMTGRPAMADGWKCTNSWGDDGVYTELWTTPEGDVGFYWEWERWKPDGLATQRLAFYTGEDQGTVVHTQYAPTGFVSIPPQDPPGEVDVHNTFRQLRAWVQVDGEWETATNVTFLVDGYGADTWAAARFDWPGGPYFVPLMGADPEEDEYSQWALEDFQGLVGGRDVIIDSMGNGIKYNGQDYQAMRLTRGYSCAVLPET